MARARKKKAKPARKRATKSRKTVVAKAAEPSQTSWQIGAGIFALVVLLGAGAYMVSTNIDTRTSVAQLVERFEVPQSVKNFPNTIRQQLPDMPSLAGGESDEGNIESAPVR